MTIELYILFIMSVLTFAVFGKVEQCQLLGQRKAAGLNEMSHSHSPFSTNFSRSAPVETNWISCPSCFSRNST